MSPEQAERWLVFLFLVGGLVGVAFVIGLILDWMVGEEHHRR